MLFNAIVLDMHPYVADDPFAKEQGMFGRLVAGSMVFSLGLGLMAHDNVNTFSYGYDKLPFTKPVFVGDTVYTIRTHLEKWPSTRPSEWSGLDTKYSKCQANSFCIASTCKP